MGHGKTVAGRFVVTIMALTLGGPSLEHRATWPHMLMNERELLTIYGLASWKQTGGNTRLGNPLCEASGLEKAI